MSTTYYLTNTTSDLSGGADFNYTLATSSSTQGTLSVSVPKNATDTSYAWTASGVPGSMPGSTTGTYSAELNVTVGETELELSVQWRRVNSSGTVQASSGATAEQTASAGVKTFTASGVDLGTWAAGDRLRLDVIVRNTAAHATRTVTLGFNDTDAEVVAPWTITTPIEQAITPATETDDAWPMLLHVPEVGGAALTRSNTAEGQTDGVTVTEANSDDQGDDALNVVSTTGVTYEADAAMVGSMGFSVPSNTGTAEYIGWDGLSGSRSVRVQFWLQWTGTPASDQRVLSIRNTNTLGGLLIRADNSLRVMQNTSGVSASTYSASANTAYRVEFELRTGTSSTGRTIVRVWSAAGALLHQWSGAYSSANSNDVTDVRLGETIGNQNFNGAVFLDDLGIEEPSTAITQAITPATEVDSATALAGAKSAAVGAATESDTAPAVGAASPIVQAITPATEVDSATALAPVKARQAAAATEVDTATALAAPSKARAVVVAAEVDTAVALGRVKSRAVGGGVPGTQASAAVPVTSVSGGSYAAQTTTVDLEPGGAYSIDTVLWWGCQTDDDYELFVDGVSYGVKSVVGGASETWTVGGSIKTAAATVKVEGTAARRFKYNVQDGPYTVSGMTFGGWQEAPGNTVPLTVTYTPQVSGVPTEADTAVAVAVSLSTAITPAVESDAAVGVGRIKARTLTPAVETDSAVAVAGGTSGGIPITAAAESDTAVALGRVKSRTLAALYPGDDLYPGSGLFPDSAAAEEFDAAANVRPQDVFVAAVEVDTAPALGAPTKARTVTLAAEVDTATALAQAKARAVTPTAEVDTSTALAQAKARAAGVAAEVDTATAVAQAKARAVTPAAEVDTSVALAAAKSRAVTPAAEVDTSVALDPAKARTVTPAAETDTATAVAQAKARAVTPAAELDAATAIAQPGEIVQAIGAAAEIDTAPALGAPTKARAAGAAAETDTATAITQPGEIAQPLGAAAETDTAPALGTSAKSRTVTPAAETDTAPALAQAKARAVTPAAETDTAPALNPAKARTVGPAAETDTAVTVQQPGEIAQAVTPAAEVDTAPALGRARTWPLTPAAEVDAATQLARAKVISLGAASESDAAAALTATFAWRITPAVEVGAAPTVGATKTLALGVAAEVDTAVTVLSGEIVYGRAGGYVPTGPRAGGVSSKARAGGFKPSAPSATATEVHQ